MGLGLVLPSCGKIPRTFSPTPTHNTQMEEGKRVEARGQEGYEGGRSADKRNSRGRKDKEKIMEEGN